MDDPAMTERLFSFETEYALATPNLDHGEAQRVELAMRLLGAASRDFPTLAGESSSGLFLANGARFYVDCGAHPEFSAPEVTNPWDAVRYVRAGEWIVAKAAAHLVAEEPSLGEVLIFRCNVDYSDSTRATWGCHSSYAHRADPRILAPQIIPHLVSRLVYSGAGGFDNRSPGIRFTLSPRVPHMQHEVSDSSTSGRGIFHTKDESLSSHGWHRLHVLCGESNCSDTSVWTKAGGTALVVAMVEAGLAPGDGVRLASPLDAMRAFANDPTCRATAQTYDGRYLTAVDIQRHYLNLATVHASESFMPPWAGDVCARWGAILDRVEEGAPFSVATTLDWATKHALFSERIEHRGFSWECLSKWSSVVERAQKPGPDADEEEAPFAPDVDHDAGSGLSQRVRRLLLARREGPSRQELERFLSLRQELFEMDTRYGQLGDHGIFNVLDCAGVLDHAVPGVDNIPHAVNEPPATGRARIRGACVKRFAGEPDRYRCDWTGITDLRYWSRLDLSDPFEKEERWQRVAHDLRQEVLDPALHRLQARLWRRRTQDNIATPEGFRVGDRVVLERQELTDDWSHAMERYVGQMATIVAISSSDDSGATFVTVDVEAEQRAWRSDRLRRAAG